jgi:organic hydroperoxide reductase OsmC/OhrA
MKPLAPILLAFAMAACTPAQDEHAREEARHAADEAKHDARVALHDAKTDTKKLSREIDADLHSARDKARKALDEPKDSPRQ